MYAHERALVARLKDEPFALVGYNFDDELEHIQAATESKNLIWRSFFGGQDDTIINKFKVKGFPTIMIIDAQGVIRGISHRTNDELIDELLAEM